MSIGLGTQNGALPAAAQKSKRKPKKIKNIKCPVLLETGITHTGLWSIK